MSASLVDSQALASLDLLDQAVWITDPEIGGILWANTSAVAMWLATDRDDLLRRNLAPSPTIRANLTALRDRVVSGERVRQERTIFPKGQATRIEMTVGPYTFATGRIGLMIEARHVKLMDPEVIRASEAVRYAPLVVVTFSTDGEMIQANVLACQTFGTIFSLNTMFINSKDINELKALVANEDVFSRDVEVKTVRGIRWYAIEARKFVDPVTGGPAILVSAHDMTARIEVEQAKEDLVSVVSHELRTPMTAIRGAIELLAGGIAIDQPELTAELLSIASENTRRLSALVDDLLDIRKLASGNVSFDLKACDLQALVKSTVALHTPAAQTKGVQLVVTDGADMPVLVDEGRIQQVILNLVSNAVKHTPAGGKVTVTGTADDTRMRISVKDEGPGVPDSFRDRIFQRFSQADASSSRSMSGTGLGLYIAKTLIELHGGTMGFDNAPNGGAVFYFDVPRRESTAA